MPLRLDLFENVLDLSVWTDEERGPGDAHHLLAVHVLLDQHTVSDGYLFLGIGQQGERQALLVGEFFLRRRGIRGDAKQHGACLLNLFICVAEPASFYRSTGRVRPGIEKKNHGFAAQVFESYFFAVLVRQSEVRGFIINFHANT